MEEIKLEIEDFFENEDVLETKVVEPVEIPTEEVPIEAEEIEETEPETTEEVSEKDNPVENVYSVLKDYIPLNETISEESLREQLSELPSKMFMDYVDTRPQIVKDLLAYQANIDNPTEEDLAKFFSTYLHKDVKYDIATPTGAREYLKTRPEFIKFYKTPEKIETALDNFEDDNELMDRAKEYFVEEEGKREEAKKQELKNKEEERKAQIEKQKQFAASLQTVVKELPWEESRKKKALAQLTSSNISSKWENISSTPRHLAEFGNLLDYYTKENGFQALYDVLEGKIKSKEAVNRKDTITKDGLGRLLNKNPIIKTGNIESFFE